MLWFSNVRKYVWNRDWTPYFTAPEQLSMIQARHELLAYCVLLGSVFGLVFVGASLTLAGGAAAKPALWLAGSGLILWACVGLVRTGEALSAWLVALAPALILLEVVQSGFEAEAFGRDRFLMSALLIALLLYGRRILRVAGRFRKEVAGALPQGPAQNNND
jgi:hypothetical protein